MTQLNNIKDIIPMIAQYLSIHGYCRLRDSNKGIQELLDANDKGLPTFKEIIKIMYKLHNNHKIIFLSGPENYDHMKCINKDLLINEIKQSKSIFNNIEERVRENVKNYKEIDIGLIADGIYFIANSRMTDMREGFRLAVKSKDNIKEVLQNMLNSISVDDIINYMPSIIKEDEYLEILLLLFNRKNLTDTSHSEYVSPKNISDILNIHNNPTIIFEDWQNLNELVNKCNFFITHNNVDYLKVLFTDKFKAFLLSPTNPEYEYHKTLHDQIEPIISQDLEEQETHNKIEPSISDLTIEIHDEIEPIISQDLEIQELSGENYQTPEEN